MLDSEGVHHPVSARGRGHAFTRYADITHLAVSPPGLWLGTRRSAYAFTRAAPSSTRSGRSGCCARCSSGSSAQPGGGAQLARINDLDARGAEMPPPRATFGLAAMCVVVFVFEALHADLPSSTPAT